MSPPPTGHPLRRLALVLGLVVLAFVAFSTIAPIGLRPRLGPVSLERAAAFGAIGMLFALAFPRRVLVVLAAVVLAAFLLEVAQWISPSRHARVWDFVVKAVGGGIGVIAALALRRILGRPAS